MAASRPEAGLFDPQLIALKRKVGKAKRTLTVGGSLLAQTPDTAWQSNTLAPATAAPEGSTTVPLSVAAACAARPAGAKSKISATKI